MKGDDIEERLVDFAVRVIKVAQAMPDSPATQHIRGQLLRSGTSSAPNYAEARSAESRRDFVHKLKIVLKELNETRVWLTIVVRSDLLPRERLDGLLSENNELCRVIGASIQTARANLSNNN